MQQLTNYISATFDIEIKGIFAITRYKLIYTNDSEFPVEAIYHFSLPRHASLFSCRIQVDEHIYCAKIQSIDQATDVYEEGVESTKAAVLIEKLKDGIYAINMANVESGASLVIDMHITHVLTATHIGKNLTYRLPTTITPRFGGSQNPIDPEYSDIAHYPFSAKIKTSNEMLITSSSHDIQSTADGLHFAGYLDKDIHFSWVQDTLGISYTGSYNDVSYVMGYPKINEISPHEQNVHKHIHLVIDRSSSMNGKSIALCREALLRLINKMPSHYLLNITYFGSTYEILFARPRLLTEETRQTIIDSINNIEADMYGTNLIQALGGTFLATKKFDGLSQVILITNGNVSPSEEEFTAVTLMSQQKDLIIHSVGVGFSVNEYMVNRLSEPSGGIGVIVNVSREMVHTIEDLCLAIEHTELCFYFHKSEKWTKQSLRYYPNLPQLHISTGYDGEILTESHTPFTQHIALDDIWGKACVHVAAQYHLHDMHRHERKTWAISLELFSKYTALVVVDSQGTSINAKDRVQGIVIPQGLPMSGSSHSTVSTGTFYADIPLFLQKAMNDNREILCPWDWDTRPMQNLLLDMDKRLWWNNKLSKQYLISKGFSIPFLASCERVALVVGLSNQQVVMIIVKYMVDFNLVYGGKLAKKRVTKHTREISRNDFHLVVASLSNDAGNER